MSVHSVLVITTLIAAALLLLNVQPGFITVVEVVALLCWTGFLLDKSFLERLASNRSGESICTFARSFDCRAVDTWIVRAVYETLQETLASEAFPLRASDRISDEMHLDDEDLEDLAEDIAERCHRTLDESESNPLYGRVETVQDLVLFLANQVRTRAA